MSMMKQFLILTLAAMGIQEQYPVISQSIIKVNGTEDSLAVKYQARQYLDYLGVHEKVIIIISFSPNMPEKMQGLAYCVNSPNDYQIIVVRIDTRQSKASQELVLAHEMIHAKQYAKGELQILHHQQVKWKNQHYFDVPSLRAQQPWELEAYRVSKLLVRQNKKQSDTRLAIAVRRD